MSEIVKDGDLVDPYKAFISKSRYARWIPEYNRREKWEETVRRYVDFFAPKVNIDAESKQEIFDAIRNHKVMPSMRAIMTAGEALERSNVAGFNCSFIAIDSPRAFDEALYILMCGTGLGFSVEKRYTRYLPEVPANIQPSDRVVAVHDSKEGWAQGYRELVASLFEGYLPKWDIRQIRPEGARLKTFGGRSSGPQPINDLFEFTVKIFAGARGRKISSIECHEIMCMIGSIVVVGGVRRAALISISSLSDDEMRDAKSGEWWMNKPHLALSNNSATYHSKPSRKEFDAEWEALRLSKSGERGIFNLAGAKEHSPERRESNKIAGTNPCGEIELRPSEFCNLSEVVVQDTDTIEDLKSKVAIATKIGTWQSTLTNFPYLRSEWKANCDEERLLGVSITGTEGHPVINGRQGKEKMAKWLQEMKSVAISTNKKEARRIGINQSAAVTAVKPSGCRPGDGLLTTDVGIYTISEMTDEHPQSQEWADVVGIKATNGDKITKTYRNGVSEVFNIKLSIGYELESTPNHQWYVSSMHNGHKYVKSFVPGWYRTDELLPGHIIDTSIGSYSNKEEAMFAPSEDDVLKYNTGIRSMPLRMNPDIAWMLGYLWGDGSMSVYKHRLRFTDENLYNIEKAQRIIKENFGHGGNIRRAGKDRNCHSLEMASAQVFAFIKNNGVWKYSESGINDIPKIVRESSYESVIAFIAGIVDSDGCVYERNGKKELCISTADAAFAKHLQQVGLAVGVSLGRSHNTKGKNKQAQKSMWIMSLHSNCDPDRLRILAKHSEKVARVMPERELRVLNPVHMMKMGKVQSVTPAGERETFDVEVENSHWYHAGSFKSHNTVSQIVGVSSGIHPWYAQYFIRRVRASKMDPMAKFLEEAGVPCEEDAYNDKNIVFSYPTAAPEGSITRHDRTAIEQAEMWITFKENWTEHNPSVTVYIGDEEWEEMADWVYEHFDRVVGMSFIPKEDESHSFVQAPYEEITKEQYEQMQAGMPEINWDFLGIYETDDNTTGSQTLACQAGQCDVADIVK